MKAGFNNARKRSGGGVGGRRVKNIKSTLEAKMRSKEVYIIINKAESIMSYTTRIKRSHKSGWSRGFVNIHTV